MAVTSAWEMGVALPIRNHKFRYGTYKSSTLNGDVTAADTTVIIVNTDPNITNVAQRGDSISIGPSTDSSYTGKSETKEIDSISSNTITLTSAVSNTYDSGDAVRIYGTRLAGHWTPNCDQGTTDNIVLPKTIMADTGEYSGGKVDDYSQRVVFDFSTADFTANDTVYAEFKYLFDAQPFLPLLHYRAGVYAKMFGRNISGDAHRALKLHDGIRSFTYAYSKVYWLQSNLQWVHWNTGNNSLILPSTPNLAGASNPHLNIYVGGRGVSDYMDMYFDDVYAEHAHETTPTTRLTYPIQTATPTYVLNVMRGSNFETGEKVLVFDQDNDTYGIGTITSASTDAIYMSDMMLFYELGTTTYTEYQEAQTEIPAGARVQQANAGYYEFTEYPLGNNLNIDLINPMTGLQVSDNSYRAYYSQADADRGDRFRVRCRFQNVTETFWQKIMVFYRWQKRGNLLNLHPKWNDLPPVMTGYMQINNITKNDHWDLTRRSFDFVFEESLL